MDVEFNKAYPISDAERGKFVVIDRSTIPGYLSGIGDFRSRGRYAVITYLAGGDSSSPITVQLASGISIAVSAVNLTEPISIDGPNSVGSLNVSAWVTNDVLPVSVVGQIQVQTLTSVFVTNIEQTSAWITNGILAVSSSNQPGSFFVTNIEQTSAWITNSVIAVSSINSQIATSPILPNTTSPFVTTLSAGQMWDINFPASTKIVEVYNFGDPSVIGARRTCYTLLSSSTAPGNPTLYGLPVLGARTFPGYYSIDYEATAIQLEVDNVCEIRVFGHS